MNASSVREVCYFTYMKPHNKSVIVCIALLPVFELSIAWVGLLLPYQNILSRIICEEERFIWLIFLEGGKPESMVLTSALLLAWSSCSYRNTTQDITWWDQPNVLQQSLGFPGRHECHHGVPTLTASSNPSCLQEASSPNTIYIWIWGLTFGGCI